ncbi:MAG: HD-like signal output (HDOD) protein [Candidatus Azotimanducaceae bacterium]|jgi:HD-like signal output (HDOD) protein
MTRPHLSIVSKTDASFEAALASGELHLPLLPRVSSMVIQLASDEDANAHQLAQLIQSDPALAGHVLRLANSPIYRATSPFVSLQQAIARLGMNAIREIALTTCLNVSLFKVPGYEGLLQRYWCEALLVSAWSREIARMRTTNVEASFLAGLLCCIGRPVVLQGVCELGLKPESIDTFVADYYVRAGLSICRSWALPKLVSTVIGHHQTLNYAGEERDAVVNVQAALQIVSAVANASVSDQSEEEADTETGPEALSAGMLAQLSFYPEDVQTLMGKSVLIDSWLKTVGV